MKLDMVADAPLEPYLERLRALPFVREARGVTPKSASRGIAAPSDANVLVRTPDGPTTLIAQLKRTHLSRELAERLVHLRSMMPDLVLFAPFVGRDLAGRFAKERLNFVDLAGNCHVEIGERYLAHVEGRRPKPVPSAHRAMRAPSYQVLFALLVKPELATAKARALAEASGGVSPQTALDARARLFGSQGPGTWDRGIFVGSKTTPKWSPRARRAALDLFIAGYSSTLAPSLVVGRYRARERDLAQMETALATRLSNRVAWRWGGGAACQRLTGYYRGDTTLIYVDHVPPRLVTELDLVVDRNGPIRIARRPTPLAFESPVADTVHPLLVYADLLMEGNERGSEAAGELARRYLADFEGGRT
jgi:hypothetical protein